jgi:CD2 antigen cytoplasmic tail-binding protein 2
MSSRYSAARPKRAGEEFARTHHSDDPSASKKPRFDVRNPSALAPDARDEDAVLDADVIGGSGAGTKRGAVNLDGYDSDSENEGFDARAEERGKSQKGDVNLFEKLQSYEGGNGVKNGAPKDVDMNDDDDDMFGNEDEDVADRNAPEDELSSKGKKNVKFLDVEEIEGQVMSSKSGGHVSGNFALDPKGKLSTHALDDQESSDDEEEAALAALEEDIDEEIGAGGRKRNAPKVDAFNMKAEQEEGRFDAEGNYVRKAADPDAVHDSWLEGVSKKDMKRAAEAHEKREAELRQKRLEDDAVLTSDIVQKLIVQLEKGETVLEALARLGKGQQKTKKIPKWKQKKKTGMDVDEEKAPEDPAHVKIRETVEEITGFADQLFTRGQTDIYDQEREMLIRQWSRETGEPWSEPAAPAVVADPTAGADQVKMWEYRWTDGRDGGARQGPFDGPTMVAWQNAGYFGEGIEFRRAGDDGPWTRVVDFV